MAGDMFDKNSQAHESKEQPDFGAGKNVGRATNDGQHRESGRAQNSGQPGARKGYVGQECGPEINMRVPASDKKADWHE